MKKLLLGFLALSLGATTQLHAKVWDDASLNAEKQKLISEINRFLAAPKGDALNKLSEKTREELYQFALKDEPKVIDESHKKPLLFQELSDPGEFSARLYAAILNSSYYYSNEQLIPFIALNVQFEPEYVSQLYTKMVDDDQRNLTYAYRSFQKYAASHSDPSVQERWHEFQNNHGFYLTGSEVNTKSDSPRICLEFSQVVNPEPLQAWQKMVSDAGHDNLQWHYHGDELCFQGDWDSTYNIAVSNKLESEDGLALINPQPKLTHVSTKIKTNNRDPMLRFATQGKVLDIYSSRNIAIETANVDKVKLKLWRIPVNNLASYDVSDLINNPQDAYWWGINSTLRDNARELFNGYFDVPAGSTKSKNKTLRSNIYLNDLISEDAVKPGVYVLQASATDEDYDAIITAFTVSNSGLTAYKTQKGLWLEVRDLKSKQPVQDTKLTLYAKDNGVLGVASTNQQGMAFFDQAAVSGENGAQPNYVIALNDERVGYLDLMRRAIDLSNKGLSGALADPLLQNWVWFDRGVYRPNDTVHAMWLLKTAEGKAFDKASIWATLIRPDGSKLLVREIKPQANGAYFFEQYFPATARLGRWKLKLSLAQDGKGFITEKTINIAAILPQQIEVKTLAKQSLLQQGKKARFDIKADWLYGAPTIGQNASVDWKINVAKDVLPKWKKWQIGVFDEQVLPKSEHVELAKTNQQGESPFSLDLNTLPYASQPLALSLNSAVIQPNGQVVENKWQGAIERKAPYAALRVDHHTAQIALINDKGEMQRGKINWKLYRVEYSWYWYRDGNNGWDYKVEDSRYLVKEDSFFTSKDKIFNLDLPINNGSWVLTVNGDAPETAAAIPIEYGYGAIPTVSSVPDTITISTDKTRYHVGDEVKVHLLAPFDGPASVKLATGKILKTYELNFVKGKAELTFNWQDGWSQGIWLLANGWNTGNNSNQNLRAVGLHWIGDNLNKHSINMAINTPEQSLPNQKIVVPISIDKLSDQSSWVQVAVVDEGLYQLAKASFTDPQRAFWGKKQIPLEMYDVWGSIIKQLKARQAAIRSGAGEDSVADSGAGLAALPELDIDLLSYWSQPVAVDKDGKAQVELELPQFNGKVRIMAVAWNQDKIGSAEKMMVVKEPLVTQFNTPLFVSPQDNSSLSVRLHNTSDKLMHLNVSLQGNQVLQFNQTEPVTQSIDLKPNEERIVQRNFTVSEGNRARFKLGISGDIEKQLERFADVRPIVLPQRELSMLQLDGKAQWQSSDVDPKQGELSQQIISLSNRAPFDVRAVLDYLYTYPYGCVEQTTSGSWNNLLLNNLVQGYALKENNWPNSIQRENNVAKAELRLANMQSYDGGFSLWGDGENQEWLTAYVVDYLLSAKQQQQLNNENMLQSALNYLTRRVNDADFSNYHYDSEATVAQAYASYVLAKAGEQNQGALLRLLPVVSDGSKVYPARLFVLNALLQQGEVEKVAEQISLMANKPQVVYFGYANYGSATRDYATDMVLLYELKNTFAQLKISDKQSLLNLDKIISAVWPELITQLNDDHYYSTQSAHWLAQLATLLPTGEQSGKVAINGEKFEVNGLVQKRIAPTEAIKLTNLSSTPLFVNLNRWIEPKSITAISNNYSLEMTYTDLEGKIIDVNHLKLNQYVVANIWLSRIEGSVTNSDMMLVYSLPAGMKVEPDFQLNGPFELTDGARDDLPRASYSENRDDRHLVAFEWKEGDFEYLHQIVLRAAKSGHWHAPAVNLQDMYQPQYQATLPQPEFVIKP